MTWSRSELRSLARRILKELIHGEKDLEGEVESAARKVFRSRVALGIVALSILSALAGWRASVFDEQSSSSTATYHQELLVQQQREQQHEATISRDLDKFGEYEQHWGMAAAAARQRPSGPAARVALDALYAQEKVAAEEILAGFEAAYPTSHPGALGSLRYPAAAAYLGQITGDTELQGLRPRAALDDARRRDKRALELNLVAALFIAALVLLTAAQVTLGRASRPQTAERQALPAIWSISRTFVLGGMLLGFGAGVLFIVVLVA
ncbi:MAG TPA: hypothetical protein VG294_09525 [Solirubrobacteraceae bacterium]|nr:hypothetical protein [Solirubrobacteraceae bacterium]